MKKDIFQRKNIVGIIIFVLCLFLLVFGCLACREKSAYSLEDCDEVVATAARREYAAYGLEEQKIKYMTTYRLSDGRKCFFQEGLSRTQKNDVINRLEKIFPLVRENGVENIYVGQIAASYVLGEVFWCNAEDSIEQLFAVLLSETDGGNYPFGFYAGQAVYLLKKQGVRTMPLYNEEEYRALESKYPRHRDLQYPLYWKKYASKEETSLAWTFSYSLVKDLYASCALESGFADKEERIKEGIAEKSEFFTVDYRFELNDAYYPIKASTPNFIYYFCADFSDAVLEKSEFQLKYADLKNLFCDTEEFVREVRGTLGKEERLPERITAYFGQNLLTMYDGHGGQTLGASFESDKSTICRSLVVFTHEIMHQILYFEEYKRTLRKNFASFSPIKRYGKSITSITFIRGNIIWRRNTTILTGCLAKLVGCMKNIRTGWIYKRSTLKFGGLVWRKP